MKVAFPTSIAASLLIVIAQWIAFPLPSQSQAMPSPKEVEADRVANEAALRSVLNDEQIRASQLSGHRPGSIPNQTTKALQTQLKRDQAEESKIQNNIHVLDQWTNYWQFETQTANWNREQDAQAQIDQRQRLAVEAQTRQNEEATEEGRQYYIEKNRPAPGSDAGYDGWNVIPGRGPF
jgi:hypothetical protein